MMTRLVRAISVALLATFLLAACSGQVDIVGTYTATSESGDVELVLKEGGKGTWSTEDDDIPFTWEKKKDSIWVHTKAGGILSGKVMPDGTISLNLPGVGHFIFNKN